MKFRKKIQIDVSPPAKKTPEYFEKFGHDTMVRTRDQEATMKICGLELQAYQDELHPSIAGIDYAVLQMKAAVEALRSFLYDRDEPVKDAHMMARAVEVWALGFLTIADAVGSVASHITTLYLIGWGALAIAAGPVFTGLAVVAGYLAFDKLLSGSKALQTTVSIVAAVVAFWGLLQWAQARSRAVTHTEASTSAPSSYVDDSAEEVPQKALPQNTDEQNADESLRQAWIKLFLSADLSLGILLGSFVKHKTNEEYVSWVKLKQLQMEISDAQFQKNSLLSLIEVAKKKCMAGILRAVHTPQKKHVPYFAALPILLFAVALLSVPAWSQSFHRREGIIIDVSGSIGSGNANNELFRQYLQTTKRLLATEPPGSRVVVSVITTDSFGSVRELLKGWTPEAHGAFDDDLVKARHQLASSFAVKAENLKAISAGTDIVGALWRMKAVLESGAEKQDAATCEIWIMSDMMNETVALPMPALLALGPEQMLEQAKANGLIVPLQACKIHVLGAATSGLTPRSWNAVKAFWSAYFKEAGAELVEYSTETNGRMN